MTGKVNEKKSKSTQFHHARDNAIASVGKVIKYQKSIVQSDAAMYQRLTQYWVGLLPISHDVEEAQLQFEFLGEMIVQEPQVLFTNDPQSAVKQVVKILAEAFQDKFWTETNKIVMANAVRYLANNAKEQFMAACQGPDMTDELRKTIEAAFNHQA